MHEQLEKIDNIALALEQANALMTLLSDYFQHANPEQNVLVARYKTYQGLYHVIGDIISEQSESASALSHELFEYMKTTREGAA